MILKVKTNDGRLLEIADITPAIGVVNTEWFVTVFLPKSRTERFRIPSDGTLVQSTGMPDKNGTEIVVGDEGLIDIPCPEGHSTHDYYVIFDGTQYWVEYNYYDELERQLLTPKLAKMLEVVR